MAISTWDRVAAHGLAEVAQRIARQHGLTVAEMFSEGRAPPLPKARAAFYEHLRELGWSFPRIGALMGKDHTTILTAIRSGPARERKELQSIHSAMIARCAEPNNPGWSNYGGRGIEVCARWRGEDGFEAFVADMGPRPHGMTLERDNVNGHYEPSNCRWATREEQGNNTRRVLAARGVEVSPVLPLAEAAE